MDITAILLDILKTPDVKKLYKDLKNTLIMTGKTHEADAFEHLIQQKFTHVSNDSDTNK